MPPAARARCASTWASTDLVRRTIPAAPVAAPKADQERRRHLLQYAQGELSPNQSFYFRGQESKLHLRAQNLETFLQTNGRRRR
jgi:hypothetical protein